MLTHQDFISSKLDSQIRIVGVEKVGQNLNKYIPFDIANKYAEEYARSFERRVTNDRARQEKSSKDSVLGKLVEEIIVYLLNTYFKERKLNYFVTNDKSEIQISNIVELLRIEKKNSIHKKHFDSDILIINPNDFSKTRRVFILSAKGTTRERIGQFLSHLFLMDQDVLNAKYGKDRYEVIFTKQNISIKYAFVTFDWATNKDFAKYTKTGKERDTVKSTEVQLILDDVKLGGGIYVLNNEENLNGIGNFASLVGRICDYLK
jgi:hypothetical protein